MQYLIGRYGQVVTTKCCHGDTIVLGNININQKILTFGDKCFSRYLFGSFICDKKTGLSAEFNEYCSRDFSRGIWKD